MGAAMMHGFRWSLAMVVLAVFISDAMAEDSAVAQETFALAVHGGAGTLRRSDISDSDERAIRAALTGALDAGHAILADGGTSLDAVTAAVHLLEDSPLFNAGRGAVYTNDGTHELDASIMNGKDLAAGAVAGVKRVKNPILLARQIMDASPHVMLAGDGAERFAATRDIELVDEDWFHTDRRLEQLKRAKERERAGEAAATDPQAAGEKFGTVGAVALDRHGNLAAATSTGGMTNKRYGRIGDSPVIGAGTYADNASCAVSATGHGEYFIRHAVAHDICARVRYLAESIDTAASEVVHHKLLDAGGTGGVIAIDSTGAIAMPFNTEGMYRGYRRGDEAAVTAIYKD